jgi:hypothetical protein
LSVVVTSRNDDHGGDPLKRLQTFVNCFDAQCRRTGLDAEVIIVEWNPPLDRPRLQTLVRFPDPCACAYRFVDVPPELHATLKDADVLPLFQMIAKNVGIRRARGRFVLATNIDIIFSNELIDYIASGRLEPGTMYRVDRHDIEAAVPVQAPLDEQMAYCAEHQLRVHTRWGSYAVDPCGRLVALLEDIVDGRAVRLGSGWHVREGTGAAGFYRWATDRAEVHVDLTAEPRVAGDAVLELELEPNPYDPASIVDLDIADQAGGTVARVKAGCRRLIRLAIPPGVEQYTFEFRWAGPSERPRYLPVFERRAAMHYLVRSMALKARADLRDSEPFRYPIDEWHVAEGASLGPPSGGEALSIVTGLRQWSYCLEYGPLRAPTAGIYRFVVSCEILEGDVAIGVLRGDREVWLPASADYLKTPFGDLLTISMRLEAGARFFLMLSNNVRRGEGHSRFLVRELTGSADPATTMAWRARQASPAAARIDREPAAFTERRGRLKGRERSRLLSEVAVRIERRRKHLRAAAQERLAFPASGWRAANLSPAFHMERIERGVSVTSDRRRLSYCLEYGPITAPATGLYRFALTYEATDGAAHLGVLREDRKVFLRSTFDEEIGADSRTIRVAVRLRAGQAFWLVISNNHPDGDGISRFVVRDLTVGVEVRDAVTVVGDAIARRILRRRDDVVQARDGRRYAADRWIAADPEATVEMEPDGTSVSARTGRRNWSYCAAYGPMRAAVTGFYRFVLTHDLREGGIAVGAQDADRTKWLRSSCATAATAHGRTSTMSIQLKEGQRFWLVVSNDHPAREGVSRFIIRELTSTVVANSWRLKALAAVDRLRAALARRRRAMQDGLDRMMRRIQDIRDGVSARSARAAAKIREARHRGAKRRERDRIVVLNSPELKAAQESCRRLEEELAQLSRLRELAHVEKLLQERRPEPLHLNGCGDFQLMAREHWCELRGYPEFQIFSMNIDGLFSSIAYYAGIRECALDSPHHIYHLEHEVGSGWTPEGEALLRRRIAERGITWLDAKDVFIWSAYMHWLKRPMIFNTSDWGFGAVPLEETTVVAGENVGLR